MTPAAEPNPRPFDLGPMETVGRPPAKAAKATKAARSKPSPATAWSAWQSDHTAVARDEFLPNVTSWIQGTAAQLLRPAWPEGSRRPTVTEVEERLAHHLDIAAGGPATTYLDALDAARDAVARELRAARSRPDPDR
jgi:hypothetical protein